MQGKYGEAEPLYERALAILEKALGPEHPHVATTLNDQAGSLKTQVRATDFSRNFLRVAKRGRHLFVEIVVVVVLVGPLPHNTPCLLHRASTKRRTLFFCESLKSTRSSAPITHTWLIPSTTGRRC